MRNVGLEGLFFVCTKRSFSGSCIKAILTYSFAKFTRDKFIHSIITHSNQIPVCREVHAETVGFRRLGSGTQCMPNEAILDGE